MKTKQIPILFIFLLLVLSACSRETTLLEYFDVQEGTVLKVPVEHSTFPYPQTNIYLTLKPPIENHPDRDFSDIFNIEVFNDKNEIEEIKAVYDINGSGMDIQIQFAKKSPKINMVHIIFGVACSGKIEILSWKPL
jgi:PBP1b-binding outer membrane lipoprotein LpoB